MSEFKQGETVEVSDDGEEWIRRTFVAFHNGVIWAEHADCSKLLKQWNFARRPEPKYREPVIQTDWGKECQFSNDPQFTQVVNRELAGRKTSESRLWLSQANDGWIDSYKFARILDTEPTR